jgi:transposase
VSGKDGGTVKATRFAGASLQTATTISLDIAKSVFQGHGVDAKGKVIIPRQLKRRYVLAFFQKLPPCMIGIEACARRDDAGCLPIRRQSQDARAMLLA